MLHDYGYVHVIKYIINQIKREDGEEHESIISFWYNIVLTQRVIKIN